MAIDRKKLAKVQGEIDSARGARFWKMKEGRHKFRLIADWPNDDGIYFRDVAAHYKVGPEEKTVICTKMTSALAKKSGKSCWLCEQVLELMGSDSKADKKMGDRMKATTRYLMNVYVRPSATEAGGLKIGQFPKSIHDAIFEYVQFPEDHGEITDVAEGHDIIVERKGSGLDTEYNTSLANKATPLAMTDKEIKAILANAVDLNKFITYTSPENMEAIFNGEDTNDDDDEARSRSVSDDDDEDEAPAKGKKAKADDDDEDEAEETKAEDDDEDAPPAKVAKANDDDDDDSSKEEEEPSDDGDGDDEPPPPPKKMKKAAPASATLAGLRSRLGGR